MPLAIVPELKKITPFIRRAEELDKDKSNPESRLVAYYCRQYAVSSGIALAKSAPAQDCLGKILNDLETEKEAMSAFTRDEAKFLCTQFATKIFNKADEEDRSGTAGKNTAKAFYAAASFFEMLGQFHAEEESEEREEEKKKLVYCKWKATEILKAIKEGRTPTPGGYGEQEEKEDEEEAAPETNEDGEERVEDVTPAPVSEDPFPSIPVVEPLMPPPMPPPDATEEGKKGEDEDVPEAGTEVELGPPPSYPGSSDATNGDVVYVPESPAQPDLPPVTSSFKPAAKPKKKGFLGLGVKKPKPSKKTVEKQVIADALELAKFAVAALEEKDADLAATRMRQALDVLGK